MVLCRVLFATADWYEKAIEQRDVWVVVQARGWFTRDLRAIHRWPAIAEKMNWRQIVN